MIAHTADGYRVVGTKGTQGRPYPTLAAALDALHSGASESCSDGACGAGGGMTATTAGK